MQALVRGRPYLPVAFGLSMLADNEETVCHGSYDPLKPRSSGESLLVVLELGQSK